MKQLLSSLIVLSAGFTTTTAAATAAEDVRIHTFDIKAETSSIKSERQMNADGALSLLKRRMGGSEATSTLPSQVDEETVQNLNELGGQHAIPFSDAAASEDRRLLLVLEGVNTEDDDSLQLDSSNSVLVPRAFHDFMREFSVNDLLSPAPNDVSRLCRSDLPFGDTILANIAAISTNECPRAQAGFTNSILSKVDEVLISTILTENESIGSPKSSRMALSFSCTDKSPFPKEYIPQFQQALKTLADEYSFESTLVLLPGHLGKNHHKRASSAHHAQKRDVNAMRQSTSHVQARSSRSSSPIFQPVCYSTNETCMEKTNSCSGHGSCYLKYSSSKSSSAEEASCYACKCARTVVRTNSDGTIKTATWGGPTCSKRDVSMPFFLIGGFTILLVLFIGYGISLLFSIGTEELPSVLSAGVAPPRGK